MNETSFWSQGWWQPIGIVIGAIVAYVIYRLQTKKKKLSYIVQFSGPLISVDEKVKNELEIIYKGRTIEQIYVLQIRVINNGGLPIRKEDFDGDIELSLKNYRSIFEVTTADYFPKNLKFNFLVGDGKIKVSPLLMNVDDFFELRITSDGEPLEFDLSARIEGISELSAMIEPRAEKGSDTRSGILIAIAGLSVSLLMQNFVDYLRNPGIAGAVSTAVSFVASITIIVFCVLHRLKR